eukprot:202083-Pelagomonas_calceolata.AAC.3
MRAAPNGTAPRALCLLHLKVLRIKTAAAAAAGRGRKARLGAWYPDHTLCDCVTTHAQQRLN